MKILFVGHDLTYLEFYSAIESELKIISNYESTHIYFRPSAWLYGKILLKLNIHTTALVRAIEPFLKYETIDLQNKLDLKFYNESEDKKYEFIFNTYLKKISKVTSNSNIDLAILPGEYRIFEQSIIHSIKKTTKIPKILYFEVGPPGYIYLDIKGVNANASFTNTGSGTLNSFKEQPNRSKSKKLGKINKYLKSILLICDLIWIIFIKLTSGLYDLTEYWLAAKNRLKIAKNKNKENKLNHGRNNCNEYYIFLAQVTSDVNNTHFGISNEKIVEYITEILNQDKKADLMWRDHPLETSEDIFNQISNLFPDRIFRNNHIKLKEAIDSALGIITVNSNGGIEALQASKPVWLLGKAYYCKLHGVHLYCQSFIKHCESIKINGIDQQVKHDSKKFVDKCFIPIDYRNRDFKNAYLAANIIDSYFNINK